MTEAVGFVGCSAVGMAALGAFLLICYAIKARAGR